MLIIPPSLLAMPTTARHQDTKHKFEFKLKFKFTLNHKQLIIGWPPFLALIAAIISLAQPTSSIANMQKLDFGRYSERLIRCQMRVNSMSKPLRSCEQLRIQQHLDGLISIRFSLNDAGRYGNEDIVFAGMVSKNSQSMFCGSDGRCKPRLPLIIEVNAISTAIFDGNGRALTLPQGLVARGSCRIEPLRAQCQATALDGASWRADGFFPVMPAPAS
jgi:hypothetical protein